MGTGASHTMVSFAITTILGQCLADVRIIRVPNVRTRDRKGASISIQDHRLQWRREDIEARTTRRIESCWHGSPQQQPGQLLQRSRHQ
jgi:hypothetical protein